MRGLVNTSLMQGEARDQAGARTQREAGKEGEGGVRGSSEEAGLSGRTTGRVERSTGRADTEKLREDGRYR